MKILFAGHFGLSHYSPLWALTLFVELFTNSALLKRSVRVQELKELNELKRSSNDFDLQVTFTTEAPEDQRLDFLFQALVRYGRACAANGHSQRQLLQRQVFSFVTKSDDDHSEPGKELLRGLWARRYGGLTYKTIVKYEADFC